MTAICVVGSVQVELNSGHAFVFYVELVSAGLVDIWRHAEYIGYHIFFQV